MPRVLIVDDKPENLYLLRALLQGHGFTVDEAPHGVAALEYARRTPPDLVISDLLMPVMDGYTLLRHWKGDAQLKSIPFIVYTATYTEPKDERLALDLGADAFILKPAEPKALMERFNAVLAQAQRRELPPARTPIADGPTLLDGYGQVLGHKLEQNINERKFAEAEARHLATFPKYNPNPVLEFSADGRLTYSNQAAKRMAETCGGADLASLLPDDTRRIASGCLASGRSYEQVETRRAQRTLSWSFFPIAELQVVHCYVEDITERLRLAEQLRQSQKMDAIGHLAAGVAHDFNNLLTVVQFEVAIMSESPALPAELRQALDQIGSATQRAATLTRQLLAFSRKQAPEIRPLDLPELVANMTRLFERILGKSISVHTQSAPGLPLIQGDPGMIEQVIMNLILNSRDAMPHGGRIDLDVREITIGPDELDRHPGGRPGQFLQLGVSDTGSGIAPADLTRIFEPFFTTKPAGKGTGLGLVTVFGIVKQHAGWIEVTSELGHGTTFLLFLPVAATAAEPVHPVYPARMQGGNETILLAEDDENIRQLLQGSLERHGYRVLVAATGPAAMEQISLCGAQVDLLITDLIMPDGMNGRDLAQRLLVSAPNLKVIYISGYAGEGPAAELKLEPGVNFLRKPFALETIVALVRRRLDEADRLAARPV